MNSPLTCIRCGSSLTQDGRRLVDESGSFACSHSMPGEASVHRVGGALPSSANVSQSSPLAGAAKIGLGFLAGRAIGHALFVDKARPVSPQDRVAQMNNIMGNL